MVSLQLTRLEEHQHLQLPGPELPDIMEAADWSRESTFKKFYHRPTQKSAFTMGVLRGQDSSDSGESGTDQVDSLR